MARRTGRGRDPADHQLAELVDLVYAAAVDDRGVTDLLLARLAAATGSDVAAFVRRDPRAGTGSMPARLGGDDTWARSFAEHWCSREPFLRLATSTLRAGLGGRGLDVLPRSEALRNDYVNEFLLSAGYLPVLGLLVGFAPAEMTSVMLLRSRRACDYDDRALALVLALGPHLSRANLLAAELARARSVGDAALAALERSPHGVVLVSQGAEVAWMNGPAEELIRSGEVLRLAEGRLRDLTGEDPGPLARRIAECGGPASLRAGPGHPLRLERASGGWPLVVVCFPLEHTGATLDGRPADVLVLINDPARAPRGLADRFRLELRLTAGETRVALLLYEGLAPREIAERIGRSVHTVQTVVKRILAKSGVRSQSEFVRRTALGNVGLG